MLAVSAALLAGIVGSAGPFGAAAFDAHGQRAGAAAGPVVQRGDAGGVAERVVTDTVRSVTPAAVAGSRFVPLGPVRIVDTRTPDVGPRGRLGAGETRVDVLRIPGEEGISHLQGGFELSAPAERSGEIYGNPPPLIRRKRTVRQ